MLVTAGASGIGKVIAAAFHREGARVHICDVVQEQIDATLQELPGVSATLADVSVPDQVDRMFADLTKSLGGLDVLINNAGIAGPTAKCEDVTPEDWERTIAVNITGQYLCARRAIPLLKAAGGGSIVNMSSVAGRFGYPLRTPYAASKWAVIGFTKSLAMEVGPHGIRVNAILPGSVRGDRVRRIMQAKAEAYGLTMEAMEKRSVSNTSLRRMIDPEDVAEMALFVCSPSGKNVSGQSLGVCGNKEYMS